MRAERGCGGQGSECWEGLGGGECGGEKGGLHCGGGGRAPEERRVGLDGRRRKERARSASLSVRR